MSDVLIKGKGMKMPKNCLTCPFSIPSYDTTCIDECILSGQFPLPKDERSVECPLIEIPPHGDLIDRDALVKTLDGELNWYCGRASSELHFIHEAPTIIPAEEAE